MPDADESLLFGGLKSVVAFCDLQTIIIIMVVILSNLAWIIQTMTNCCSRCSTHNKFSLLIYTGSKVEDGYSGAVISTETVQVSLDRPSTRPVSPPSSDAVVVVDLNEPNGTANNSAGVIRQGFGKIKYN